MKRLTLLLLLVGGVAHAASVTAFVAPDSFPVIDGFISSANTSLIVNAYTFEHPAIAAALARAKGRGVDVVVLAEAKPVGGITAAEHHALCTLTDAGVPVLLHTNRQLVHAKYAIRDGTSSLIATENFGPTGYPDAGTGNRGWGAVIYDDALSRELAGVFVSDMKGAEPYICKRVEVAPSGRKPHEPRFPPKTFQNQRVRLVVAPDATHAVVDFLHARTLYIEEFYISPEWGKGPNPFLETAIESARNNGSVKILLDATWYNTDEGDNDEVVSSLNAIAAAEHLDLAARLADPAALGVEKLHVKGVVADDAVLISSINWNEASPTKDREVGVVIEGEAAAYFRDAFMHDWNGGRDTGSAPLTGKAAERRNDALVIAVVVLLVLAALVLWYARRKGKI